MIEMNEKNKIQEVKNKFVKPFVAMTLVAFILAFFIVYIYLGINRNNHFYLADEFVFQRVVLSAGASMGVFAMFSCTGLLVTQVIVWRINLDDVYLKKMGFVAITILFTSLFMILFAYKIFSISCNYAPFSFEWIIEGFFSCLLTGDAFLVGGFLVTYTLTKEIGKRSWVR